jgi:hypothetical protein
VALRIGEQWFEQCAMPRIRQVPKLKQRFPSIAYEIKVFWTAHRLLVRRRHIGDPKRVSQAKGLA